MNVLLFELRSLRVFATAWLLGLMTLAGTYISVYPTFSREADTIRKVFEAFPAPLRAGMGLEPRQLFSFLGFFTNVAHFVILAAAIEAAVLGFIIFSRERRTKTADFLLARPRRRGNTFIQKFTAGLLIIIVTTGLLGCLILLLAGFVHAGNINQSVYWHVIGALGLTQLWFYAVSSLLATWFRLRHSSSGPGLAFATGMFFVGMIGSLVDTAKTRWVSPFKYVDLSYVLAHGTYQIRFIIYSLLWIFVSAIICYLLWTRRDVPAEG